VDGRGFLHLITATPPPSVFFLLFLPSFFSFFSSYF
jgi:hypothetical protein